MADYGRVGSVTWEVFTDPSPSARLGTVSYEVYALGAPAVQVGAVYYEVFVQEALEVQAISGLRVQGMSLARTALQPARLQGGT